MTRKKTTRKKSARTRSARMYARISRPRARPDLNPTPPQPTAQHRTLTQHAPSLTHTCVCAQQVAALADAFVPVVVLSLFRMHARTGIACTLRTRTSTERVVCSQVYGGGTRKSPRARASCVCVSCGACAALRARCVGAQASAVRWCALFGCSPHRVHRRSDARATGGRRGIKARIPTL